MAVDEDVGGRGAGKVPGEAGDASELRVGGAPKSADLRTDSLNKKYICKKFW